MTSPEEIRAAWLARLAHERARVVHTGDVEAVHQLRVALARLRVWLWLADEPKLARRVRALRRRAGPVRDLDVVLSFRPPGRQAATLRLRRRTRLDTLRARLARPKVDRLLAALRAVPPLDEVRARARLDALRPKLAVRGVSAGVAAGEPEALHALRRAARRLRFGLELLGESPRAAKAVQSALGAVCDVDLCLASPGAGAAFVAHLAASRGALVEQAQARWAESRAALEGTGTGAAHPPSNGRTSRATSEDSPVPR